MYPWLVLGSSVFGLLSLSYFVYHYFANPKESYWLATLAVVLSLTVSFLCAMLIPVDIYVISEGGLKSESLHVSISQEQVQNAYFILFATLLFLALCVVPHAYFYGEARGSGDFDLDGDKRSCWIACRSTAVFVALVLFLLVAGLNFRPGRTETLDRAMESREEAARWVGDLLDQEHGGLNAVSFAIACLTFVGVGGWVFYTAYGMAALPFSWLRGRQSASQQRSGVEQEIAAVRDQFRAVQAKFQLREDGTPDLGRMRAADRKEFNRLQREYKSLVKHNYRLQEMEEKVGFVIPRLLQFLIPFRWAIGISMMGISLLVVVSLLMTLLDRLIHSDCGWQCGYALQERRLFNPADDIFMYLSRVFPLDFLVLGILVLYIFVSSVYGIVSLGVRFLCFNVYTLLPQRSMPQALLVLCSLMSYILLALCMALMTIAPNYTSFGSQSMARSSGGSGRCSLERGSAPNDCQVSVISSFFVRIAVVMPFLSTVYYFANWAFIFMYGSVFSFCLLSQQQQQQPFYEDNQDDLEEEEMGLLMP
eukprot:CAMPEP_0206546036 /NCGR_PEP_ID=MMETSP0325_2-20121206/12474_1 /ASSEMBLY_ACC=CAM_ASM_000347 /TAXON_ID=2866 /ORGANISM="Crypthecodinium cohnii, Strain Seligo" /LENGTH=534 /DNA_ID=CAMNT_0054045099 /DNA_START=113 /DNA_END=1714 /DNA_ORIENTATION=-